MGSDAVDAVLSRPIDRAFDWCLKLGCAAMSCRAPPVVVISGAFIIFLLHNHSVIYKIIIFFSGEAKDSAIFPFFILLHTCFTRELNTYSPLVFISQIIN